MHSDSRVTDLMVFTLELHQFFYKYQNKRQSILPMQSLQLYDWTSVESSQKGNSQLLCLHIII